MKFDEKKLYLVEGRTLGYVLRVMERLYGPAFAPDGDEKRDLANGLYAHLTQNVVEYEESRP